MKVTEQYLSDVLARCDKTSNGPWKSYIEGRDHDSGSNIVQTANRDFEIQGAMESDFDFIAHAKQDIPILVAEIRRLQEES